MIVALFDIPLQNSAYVLYKTYKKQKARGRREKNGWLWSSCDERGPLEGITWLYYQLSNRINGGHSGLYIYTISTAAFCSTISILAFVASVNLSGFDK